MPCSLDRLLQIHGFKNITGKEGNCLLLLYLNVDDDTGDDDSDEHKILFGNDANSFAINVIMYFNICNKFSTVSIIHFIIHSGGFDVSHDKIDIY